MQFPVLDPLLAAEHLRSVIIGDRAPGDPFGELSKAIDGFVYSLQFLLIASVRPIQDTDEEPPEGNYTETYTNMYNSIAVRFAFLGQYWTVESEMAANPRPETMVGDAIDDLTDIASDLQEVHWYLENHGPEEALAALRWRYESHLWMHVLPLRAHLEVLRYSEHTELTT